MSKAYCIDASASMSDEMIIKAFEFVRKGIEPGDRIIAFDVSAWEVTDGWLNNPCVLYGRGGTDAIACLALAKEFGCYGTVLISDGYMIPEQLAQFNKFIDIESL